MATNEELDTATMNMVANLIGVNWKKLANYLFQNEKSLNIEMEVENLDQMHKTLYDKCFGLLNLWKMRAENPTRQNLTKILKAAGTAFNAIVTELETTDDDSKSNQASSQASSQAPSSQVLSQKVQHKHMSLVSKSGRAKENWKQLTGALDLKNLEPDLRRIVNQESYENAVYKALEYWVSANGKDATVGKLVNILKEEGLKDLAEELLQSLTT